jgi:hypothetical protein
VVGAILHRYLPTISQRRNENFSMTAPDEVDLVTVIAEALVDLLPSIPMDVALLYAERIAAAIQRAGYVKTL